MEVNSTEGEDAATETIVSIIKSTLVQVDVVMQEDNAPWHTAKICEGKFG